MKEFLGLLFLMGIIHKPAIHMYWSKDPLFSTPIFHAIMSRNRFQLLLSFSAASMVHSNTGCSQQHRLALSSVDFGVSYQDRRQRNQR